MSASPLKSPAYDASTLDEEGAIDLIYLSRQTMGNSVLEREILALFLTQAQVCIQKLEEILDQSRAEADGDTARNWKMMTHTLKGSARGVGAWETADAACAAECRCPTVDHADAQKALHALARSVDETCAFIDRFCDTRQD